MKKLPELKALVRQQAERLRRFELNGTRCEVVIDEIERQLEKRRRRRRRREARELAA
jgi:hypothetical protein